MFMNFHGFYGTGQKLLDQLHTLYTHIQIQIQNVILHIFACFKVFFIFYMHIFQMFRCLLHIIAYILYIYDVFVKTNYSNKYSA